MVFYFLFSKRRVLKPVNGAAHTTQAASQKGIHKNPTSLRAETNTRISHQKELRAETRIHKIPSPTPTEELRAGRRIYQITHPRIVKDLIARGE
jgi:hypothetical protein